MRIKQRPRVAGIPVDIDWRSFSLGAVLPLPYLAQSLPADERVLDWLPVLLGAGVLAGILLALGGLFHELGHVDAARLVGLAAESIRLGFASRVTVFPGEAPQSLGPRTTLIVVLAGPLATLGYAAVWIAMRPLVADVPLLGPVCDLLILVHVALAAFNLLPVGPSDGRLALTAANRLFRSTARPAH